MGGFERFCWAVTALASIAAAALLGTAFLGHNLGAPQQTAFAAIGVAVIPYVFTRAIQAMGRGARQAAFEPHPRAEAERPETPAPIPPAPEARPEPRWDGASETEAPTVESPAVQFPAAEASQARTPETKALQTQAPRAGRRRAGLFRAEFPPLEPSGPKPDPIEPAPLGPVTAGPSAAEPTRSQAMRAEPAFTLADEGSGREPLVARDRLVEPPPGKPKREGMGRLFWILVGILVVLLAVAAFLVMGGMH